jgi:alkylated DNA repair protein alkB family protein 6
MSTKEGLHVDVENLNIEDYKVEGPSSIYYIPGFVSEVEESYILRKVNEAPLPRWTQLSNRRLQNWGGDPHPKGMIAEALPDWLKKYTDCIGSIKGIFVGCPPNHVLVNEYRSGQGIMPHLDGPLFYPTITTISLGSHAVLNFYRPLDPGSGAEVQESSGDSATEEIGSWSSRLEFSLLVQPQSLLILRDQAYDYYLHGIDEVGRDTVTEKVINAAMLGLSPGDELERSTRVSLTIRHVPKTTKPMLKLFGIKR